MNKEEIKEIEEGLFNISNPMKEYKYNVMGQKVTMMVSGRTVIIRNLPSKVKYQNEQAVPSYRIIDYCDMVILINDDGRTYVYKNRWGNRGVV